MSEQQIRSTEALFMAFANAEEANRCARAAARSRVRHHGAPHRVDLDNLVQALQLTNKITTELGQTVWHYGRALYNARANTGPSPLSVAAYDVARELHALAAPLRRGTPVDGALAAITTLDTVVTNWRIHRNRPGGDA
ncbi:hypothetical protein [Actinophytocola sp.]|uniref:hypothetical protein n=1 Tax=Actinophytocola sp. TaxID=1872138 RepID=UPI002ED41F45